MNFCGSRWKVIREILSPNTFPMFRYFIWRRIGPIRSGSQSAIGFFTISQHYGETLEMDLDLGFLRNWTLTKSLTTRRDIYRTTMLIVMLVKLLFWWSDVGDNAEIDQFCLQHLSPKSMFPKGNHKDNHNFVRAITLWGNCERQIGSNRWRMFLFSLS